MSVGLGCALELFAEHKEIQGIVENLPKISGDKNELELERERFSKVLDYYQEQPHLLDPHLASLLESLLANILNAKDQETIHASCAFAAHLVKVRGYKVVLRHLPHETHHFQPVIQLLKQQDPSAADNWETRYFLLLWLSILVLIPFHMSRFDDEEKGKQSLMDKVLEAIKTYLRLPDKCQDAAAYLAAKFMTRPEIVVKFLPEFLDWSLQIVATPSKDRTEDVTKMGALKALSAIYKHGKRQDLLKDAPIVLRVVVEAKLEDDLNVLIKKLGVKLVQRLGLTFLKAKVATWRYQRGSRSLALNLEKDREVKQDDHNVGDEDGYDVPDDMEEVIEQLLCGLRSNETIIRWSAAKGIGRVTGRLPKELADDVVASLLQLFSLRASDGAWHGGCLALAELARRGLLLPQRLPEVVSVVLKALIYDERRGCFSVGAHVRDAACYVCWAFARAYAPSVLQPYVPNKLAPALLVTTVFDREVNCRRAASAAFQENVGRLGAEAVPNGIDLVTACDYHSVGSRNHAYTSLSVYVAQHSDYIEKLVQHLLENKVGHWDTSIRELTGQALGQLTPLNTQLVLNKTLPQLLNMVEETKDLYERHGSIVAVGEVVLGLAGVAEKEGKKLDNYLDDAMILRVKNIVITLEQKMALRGSGGELLRGAVSTFIQHMSEAHFPCHKDQVVDLWKMILDENLSNGDPVVQERAISTVAPFVSEYYSGENAGKLDSLIQHYTSQLDVSELHRRGFSLAIGSLPTFALKGRLDFILPTLIGRTVPSARTEVWAEGRRDAVKAIGNVVKTLGVHRGHKGEDCICESNIVPLYECYLKALEDYTVDRRGDVGAWVREAAMSSLVSLTFTVVEADPSMVPQVCIEAMMPRLAQQAVEKIDRTRGHAGQLFASLILSNTPHIPHQEKIKGFLPKEVLKGPVEAFDWTVESQTFPVFVQLLRLSPYSHAVLTGLIVSVGGLTERLVRHSSESLFRLLCEFEPNEMKVFCALLLVIFGQNQKEDRITLPLLKFLDSLLANRAMEPIMSNPENGFSFDLFTLVKTEILKCGEPNKLVTSCDVFCSLLNSKDRATVGKCLVQLSIFLCHKFPRIRKVAAAKLFEALLMYEGPIVPEENLDQVNAILSDTNWDLGVEKLRPIRNNLCELMDVPPPALIKKPI